MATWPVDMGGRLAHRLRDVIPSAALDFNFRSQRCKVALATYDKKNVQSFLSDSDVHVGRRTSYCSCYTPRVIFNFEQFCANEFTAWWNWSVDFVHEYSCKVHTNFQSSTVFLFTGALSGGLLAVAVAIPILVLLLLCGLAGWLILRYARSSAGFQHLLYRVIKQLFQLAEKWRVGP